MTRRDLILREEVYEVVGCALTVHNELGHGLLEKPYENALAVEMGLKGIDYQQQQRFPVMYKGVEVGVYVPDLIAYGKIIVDTKVIKQIGEHELGQMINYLKLTGLQVGLIINFKNIKMEWKRVVLEEAR
jgi:GxxExxY protein